MSINDSVSKIVNNPDWKDAIKIDHEDAKLLLRLSLETMAQDVANLFKEKFKNMDEVVKFANSITKQII